ncbi:MAG: bifunctional nuclease family protein [Candidatus Latescibacterota bacterium]|nr:MAG: bifunctional nuclease family protein [Candidatus Latescibacterota bacterium]
MVEVQVSGLALDDRNKTPVVLLREREGTRVLPIWIGPSEANSIAMELAGKKFQRPLTHDLLKTVIEGLHGKVTKVLITELKESTFYARVLILQDNDVLGIDARPSDSIALALRAGSPIFVSESLFQLGREEKEISEEETAEALRKFLRNLPPEDFGKVGL